MKSMLLARVLVKRCRSLQKCRDAHESKNQEELNREVLWRPRCSYTINAVLIVPGAKGSGSELFPYFDLFSEAWWARFDIAFESLYPPFWCFFREFPLRDSSLRDCWVFLFSLLSGSEQFCPKWPSL